MAGLFFTPLPSMSEDHGRITRMKAHFRVIVALASLVLLGGGVLLALPAQAPQPACTVTGRVLSSGVALPGVSVTAMRDGQVVAATSTDTNGA